MSGDFPGSLVVKTLPSKAGIPGQRTKIPTGRQGGAGGGGVWGGGAVNKKTFFLERSRTALFSLVAGSYMWLFKLTSM